MLKQLLVTLLLVLLFFLPGAFAQKSVEPATEFSKVSREVKNMLEAQIALARLGISPGVLDGLDGRQTSRAIATFQKKYDLKVTGKMDSATCRVLHIYEPVFIEYTVSHSDKESLTKIPEGWYAKSLEKRLDYVSILELVAERSHSSQDLIRRMNLQIQWSSVAEGTTLQIPYVWMPRVEGVPEKIVVSLEERSLSLLDAKSEVLFYAPCSIAGQSDKAPRGRWTVTSIKKNPTYRFSPENFPASIEGKLLGRELILPSGPNNPVGKIWIGLSKIGYGIHGTPEPEKIGITTSIGCIRLSNWDAEALASYIEVGLPVYVED